MPETPESQPTVSPETPGSEPTPATPTQTSAAPQSFVGQPKSAFARQEGLPPREGDSGGIPAMIDKFAKDWSGLSEAMTDTARVQRHNTAAGITGQIKAEEYSRILVPIAQIRSQHGLEGPQLEKAEERAQQIKGWMEANPEKKSMDIATLNQLAASQGSIKVGWDSGNQFHTHQFITLDGVGRLEAIRMAQKAYEADKGQPHPLAAIESYAAALRPQEFAELSKVSMTFRDERGAQREDRQHDLLPGSGPARLVVGTASNLVKSTIQSAMGTSFDRRIPRHVDKLGRQAAGESVSPDADPIPRRGTPPDFMLQEGLPAGEPPMGVLQTAVGIAQKYAADPGKTLDLINRVTDTANVKRHNTLTAIMNNISPDEYTRLRVPISEVRSQHDLGATALAKTQERAARIVDWLKANPEAKTLEVETLNQLAGSTGEIKIGWGGNGHLITLDGVGRLEAIRTAQQTYKNEMGHDHPLSTVGSYSTRLTDNEFGDLYRTSKYFLDGGGKPLEPHQHDLTPYSALLRLVGGGVMNMAKEMMVDPGQLRPDRRLPTALQETIDREVDMKRTAAPPAAQHVHGQSVPQHRANHPTQGPPVGTSQPQRHQGHPLPAQEMTSSPLAKGKGVHR